ncbi:RICIN domain-containing protein [Streptomyces sp. NPDC003300]|uniref:RICIN domain-containing protein n=1 Tax=unclassified Streptomyces TaxID=2593676 RepID=UPI0033B198F0
MDRVIRVLATACDRENRAVPVAHVVVVGPETVWFHLRTPDQRPPAGWTADQDGRTWHAQLRWLQSASVAESLPEPYPRLVPLGNTGKGFVLLNLGEVGGLIGLEGDARQARALAHDWARELAASPWSREVRVVRVGFKPVPGAGAPAEPQDPADTDAALEDEAGGVLLLGGSPGGRDRERFQRLADDPDGRWTVVVVGRTDQPRWRFTIDSAGVVDTGLLDERVAHRLDPDAELPPSQEGDDIPVGRTAGRPAEPGPRTKPVVTRGRVVVASVAVLCLAGIGLGLALHGSSSPSTTVAHASDTTTAPAPTTAGPSPSAASPSGAAPGSAPPASAPPASAPPASAPASGPASAANAPKPPGAPLKNAATGKCLTAGAGTDGTPLALAACDDSLVQRWHISPDGTIRANDLCMDAAWGGTAPGTVVQVANCSGNVAQKFSLRGSTVYSAHAALCLSEVDNGSGVRLAPCGAGGPEAFKRP